jgi:hypothetical protein
VNPAQSDGVSHATVSLLGHEAEHSVAFVERLAQHASDAGQVVCGHDPLAPPELLPVLPELLAAPLLELLDPPAPLELPLLLDDVPPLLELELEDPAPLDELMGEPLDPPALPVDDEVAPLLLVAEPLDDPAPPSKGVVSELLVLPPQAVQAKAPSASAPAMRASEGRAGIRDLRRRRPRARAPMG